MLEVEGGRLQAGDLFENFDQRGPQRGVGDSSTQVYPGDHFRELEQSRAHREAGHQGFPATVDPRSHQPLENR